MICQNPPNQIIKKHTKKIQKSTIETNNQCNSRDKSTSPYRETASSPPPQNSIQGHSKDKQFHKILLHRHNKGNLQTKNTHKLLLSNWKYWNNVTISAYIWKLKDGNITPNISWEVIKSAPTYNNISISYLLLHPWKSCNNHPHITKYTIKPQIWDNLKISTQKQTSIPIWPKHLTKTLTKFYSPSRHFFKHHYYFNIHVHITQ